MNRKELVNATALHGDVDAKTVDAILRSLTEVITATVARGEPVMIQGFAKFAKVERNARMGRNPQTGAEVHIPASVKARITPLKQLKEVIAGAEAAPQLRSAAAAEAG